MISVAFRTAVAGLAAGAARPLILVAALLCYGSAPNVLGAQTEYESQVEEIAAASGSAHHDLRIRLRGAAQRRTGVTVLASLSRQLRRTGPGAVADEPRAAGVSLGLSAPLRC